MARTGFSPAERLIILQRDQMCVPHAGSCGGALVIHHRANRGMGGSRRANTLANGLTVCSHFNTLMESDAAVAERARLNGWKVARNGHKGPEEVLAWIPWLGAWVWLTEAGDYREFVGPTHVLKSDDLVSSDDL